MRHHFTNLSRPKRVSKELRRELALLGLGTSLSTCQDLVARMYGYSHWHQLQAETGRSEASVTDWDLLVADGDAYQSRIDRQTAVIVEAFPIGQDRSECIVRSIEPTGPGWRSARPDEDTSRVVTHVDLPGISGIIEGSLLAGTRQDGKFFFERVSGPGASEDEIILAASATSGEDFAQRHFFSSYLLLDRHVNSSRHDEEEIRHAGIVTRYAHGEALDACRAVGNAFGQVAPRLYDILRAEGLAGERRRMFAGLFPKFADIMLLGDPAYLEIVDGTESPYQALYSGLKKLLRMNALRLASLMRRILYSGMEGISGQHIEFDLRCYAALPKKLLPDDPGDLLWFFYAVRALDEALPAATRNRQKVADAILAKVKLDFYGWRGVHGHMDAVTRAARNAIDPKSYRDPVENVPLALELLVLDVFVPLYPRETREGLLSRVAPVVFPRSLDGLATFAAQWISGKVRADVMAAGDDIDGRIAAWRQYLDLPAELVDPVGTMRNREIAAGIEATAGTTRH